MKILSSPLALPTTTLFKRFEGGAVYTAERGNKYLVIIDESTMSELLDPDELEGIELVKTIEFESDAERTDYLKKRFEQKTN